MLRGIVSIFSPSVPSTKSDPIANWYMSFNSPTYSMIVQQKIFSYKIMINYNVMYVSIKFISIVYNIIYMDKNKLTISFSI